MNMKPTRTRRATLCTLAALALGASLPMAAQAQANTVKLILPNAAGSGVDAIARAAQPALAKALGQSVVVDNQPGASGVIGLQALSRAAPDGHTFSVVSNNVVILPHVLKSVPFKMPEDFTPIAVIGATPLVLVANPAKVAASHSKDFVALLKAKPDGYNFASGGTGTILHLAGEMFLDEAKVTAKHIPYKGVGQMTTDLIGGQVDFGVLGINVALPHMQGGALKGIGVSSAQRSPAAPNLPTFAEQGLPGYVVEGWIAVLGPKNLPAAQVKRMHDALVAAFDAPEVKGAMTKQGNVIHVTTPEQALTTFRQEGARFGEIVKKAGVTLP